MKEKFFKIVGVFSLVMASLTLLIAIICGFTATNQLLGSANENIEHPEIKLKDIHDNVIKPDNKENTTKQTTENTNKEDEKYYKSLDPILKSIVTALNEYGLKTNQGSVKEEGLEDYLLSNTRMMNRDHYLLFLKNLNDASLDLKSQSDKIANLDPEDEKYIDWSENFLPWFIESYVNKYNKELKRIEDEKLADQENLTSSLVVAGSAAGSFLLFVFFTLILLMVQIEKNTRKP